MQTKLMNPTIRNGAASILFLLAACSGITGIPSQSQSQVQQPQVSNVTPTSFGKVLAANDNWLFISGPYEEKIHVYQSNGDEWRFSQLLPVSWAREIVLAPSGNHAAVATRDREVYRLCFSPERGWDKRSKIRKFIPAWESKIGDFGSSLAVSDEFLAVSSPGATWVPEAKRQLSDKFSYRIDSVGAVDIYRLQPCSQGGGLDRHMSRLMPSDPSIAGRRFGAQVILVKNDLFVLASADRGMGGEADANSETLYEYKLPLDDWRQPDPIWSDPTMVRSLAWPKETGRIQTFSVFEDEIFLTRVQSILSGTGRHFQIERWQQKDDSWTLANTYLPHGGGQPFGRLLVTKEALYFRGIDYNASCVKGEARFRQVYINQNCPSDDSRNGIYRLDRMNTTWSLHSLRESRTETFEHALAITKDWVFAMSKPGQVLAIPIISGELPQRITPKKGATLIVTGSLEDG